MFNAAPHRSVTAYTQVALDTRARYGDDHTLIQLLYDEALLQIGIARSAMERDDPVTKGRAINKATTILVEGLLAALDPDAGGELAANLARLYLYMTDGLVAAHHANDVERLTEVRDLLVGLRDAWAQIKNTPAARQARTAPC